MLVTAVCWRFGEHGRHRIEREPGVHGLGAVRNERCDMVRVEGVACLYHEAHARAKSGAHEMMTHGTQCQERGDRCAAWSSFLVTQHE